MQYEMDTLRAKIALVWILNCLFDNTGGILCLLKRVLMNIFSEKSFSWRYSKGLWAWKLCSDAVVTLTMFSPQGKIVYFKLGLHYISKRNKQKNEIGKCNINITKIHNHF